jgi:hypothetical protein
LYLKITAYKKKEMKTGTIWCDSKFQTLHFTTGRGGKTQGQHRCGDKGKNPFPLKNQIRVVSLTTRNLDNHGMQNCNLYNSVRLLERCGLCTTASETGTFRWENI